MSSIPVRVDDELFAEAKSVGEVMSRSAAQQLQHWARLGRELERASTLSPSAVEQALGGALAYDALNDTDQAVVRAAWSERIDVAIARIDLALEFTEAGESWTEADELGHPISRGVAAAPPAGASL